MLDQHLEDAAFCWLRRQGGLWNPLFAREHMGRIDRVLDAHLEGVRVAGSAAVAPALQSLQRWKTPDEAFVSTYALIHSPDAAALAALEQALESAPELAQGAAAALLWAGNAAAMPLMQRWWRSGQSALRRAAVPAAMRHPQVNRDTVILDGEEDADASLRARAYRAVGEWRLMGHAERLRRGLDDTAPLCRFEAAYALSLLGDAAAAARIPAEFDALQGSTRRRAVLAWAAGADAAPFAATFNRLVADRRWHRDLIWALAFRGDPAGLVQLCHWLQLPEFTRLAAYAIAHITGVDLEAEGLCVEEEEPDEGHALDTDDAAAEVHDEAEEHDEDDGLPEPEPVRLSAWARGRVDMAAATGRQVGGQPLEAAHPLDGTEYTMPQLWQITHALCRRGEEGVLTALRAPAVHTSL